MPYTLTLTIPSHTTKAQMLAEATVTNFVYFTYTWQHTDEETAQQKEQAEQIHSLSCAKGLSIILIFSDSEEKRRISLSFDSKEAAEAFLTAHRELKLPFYSHANNSVDIITSHLNPLAFEKLKTAFRAYFNFSEALTNEIGSIAAPLANSRLHKREAIKHTFKQALEPLIPLPGHSLSIYKLSIYKLRQIDALSQTLVQQAWAFDNDENLQQNTAMLALGNLFLSFNLYFHAIEVFNKISPITPEYCDAQVQLASLYLSPHPIYDPLQREVLPLGVSNIRLENGFRAALNAKAPILAATAANLLCGLEEGNPYFTTEDFQFCTTIHIHPLPFWLKIFAIIREQGGTAKLKPQLATNNGAPVLPVFQNANSKSAQTSETTAQWRVSVSPAD